MPTINLTDSISVDDSDAAEFNGGGLGTSYMGSAPLGGVINRDPGTSFFSILLGRVLGDSVSATSIFSRVLTALRTLSSSITVSENFTAMKIKVQDVSDAVTVSSVITRVLTAIRTLVESITASSVFSQYILRSVSKTLTLIYNIFAFVLGNRSKPVFFLGRTESSEILGTGGETPLTLNVNGDKPTIMSAKTE